MLTKFHAKAACYGYGYGGYGYSSYQYRQLRWLPALKKPPARPRGILSGER
ncbi:MAG: hypothetical protein IPO95_13255 [Rhodanobacteraceae bacterium]|nr:hypothetical protein [Rhodanobacteraceae bacterium]